MCYGCWQEVGEPQIDNPQVRQAADCIREVYEWRGAGGSLHTNAKTITTLFTGEKQ